MALIDAISAASERLSYQWPYVLTAVLACGVAWLLQVTLKSDALSKIPLHGNEIGDADKRREAYMKDARKLLADGTERFKNGIWRVTTARKVPTIVLDKKYLKELKELPDDTVSFMQAIDETLHTKWTKVNNSDTELIVHVVKKDLTPALHRLNPMVAEEVDSGFREELPDCQDWTRVALNKHLLRIVAKVSGRIFVGPELCRTEEYIDMGINYTVEISNASRAIAMTKPSERDAKAPHLPEVKQLDARRKQAMDFLLPVVEARKKVMAEDSGSEMPNDVLQWILNSQSRYGDKSIKELAETQLGLTFAAIHTTTMTTTNVFYTLAAFPEYVPELRDEIRTVLAEHGTFTSAALQQMKKLDSFLREVMRVTPLSYISFHRKTLQPFVLSTGELIPAGVTIQIAAEPAMSDGIERPEDFDPWRSYRLREQQGLEGVDRASAGAANQMVTVSPNNLTFGYGRHACPGRFFAVNEIKMILGRAILDYDIRPVDGGNDRYANIDVAEQSIPDPSKELLFKRVQI